MRSMSLPLNGNPLLPDHQFSDFIYWYIESQSLTNETLSDAFCSVLNLLLSSLLGIFCCHRSACRGN